MAKKFNANSLNAVDYAIDTISDAVNNPETIAPVTAKPEVQQPESETILSVEKEKDATELVSEENNEKPTARKKKSKAAPDAEKNQKPIAVNILMPPSVYKRMMNMKTDYRKPLNQIGLEAIIKWLEKNDY